MAARRWRPSWIKKRAATGNLKFPMPVAPGRPATGSKMNLAIDGADDRRQDVRFRVVRDVSGDLGDPAPVQHPLGLKFGLNVLVFGSEEAREDPERAHDEEELAARLLPADRRQMELETGHGLLFGDSTARRISLSAAGIAQHATRIRLERV